MQLLVMMAVSPSVEGQENFFEWRSTTARLLESHAKDTHGDYVVRRIPKEVQVIASALKEQTGKKGIIFGRSEDVLTWEEVVAAAVHLVA